MTFRFSEEQESLGALVRRTCGEKARSRDVHDGDAEAGDPPLWSDLGEAGLLTLGMPEARGGAGGTTVDQFVVAHELGRVVSPAPFVSSTMVAGSLLGVADTHTDLVTAMASGHVVATALEHPNDIELTLGEDRPRLDGIARLVLDGTVATTVLVAVAATRGPRVAVVDLAEATVDRVSHPTLDRGRPVATVCFDDTPAELLGPDGDWGDRITAARRAGFVGLAAESAGLAERCLELAREHALTRRQFGEIIGQFQAVKHRLADMLVAVENAKSAAQLGAWALAEGREDADLLVAAAKAEGTGAAVRVASDALQLHGGIAITWEHDLHLYLRRAKTNEHLWGEPVGHRDHIARRLLAVAT